MADEREAELEALLEDLNQQMLTLAEKMEETAGVDCSLGACVLDPSLESIEEKIEEVQRRKTLVEGMLKHLDDCAT